MPNITVVCVGGHKDSFIAEAESEYIKRLSPYCEYRICVLKEELIPDEGSPAAVKKALQAEAVRIRAALPKRGFVVALCVEGKKMTSEAFAALTAEKLSLYSDIAFIIGSSHGLDNDFKRECGLLLSVSDMTFPHRLMRPILAEQIYRAFTIINGKRYHK